MKAAEIILLMNKWAPPHLVDEWDNTGFQIGDPEKEVKKILLSLDLDRRVFEKALEINAHMIITHHPIIFKPLKALTRLNYKERLIYDIIKEDIVIYNAHTNLDIASGGVNDTLAKILEIQNPEPLRVIYEESSYELPNKSEQFGYGRIGTIDEIDLDEYLIKIKESLDTKYLIVYGNKNKSIKTVAVCGGSGGSFIDDAYLKKADIYITGDIKYHEAQYGDELGLTIIDAGHYHTEKVILAVIKNYLIKGIEEPIEVEIYTQSSPPYTVF